MHVVRFLLLLTLLSSVPCTVSLSQEKGLGAGIVLGEPTGITVKSWLNTVNAWDAGLAWSFVRETNVDLHADYLWHDFSFIHASEELIPVYYGLGGRIKSSSNSSNARVGVRVVGGIAYYFPKDPIDVFLEIAPIIDLLPSTELSFNSGIGIRYFFK